MLLAMAIIQSYTNEDFFKGIPNLETKTLLDVGAGGHCSYSVMGYLSHLYNQRARIREELDAEAYQECERFKKNIVAIDLKYENKDSSLLSERSLCADARNLPFDAGMFDMVAMGWLLDYFKTDSELGKVISESVRVLKPKGYLVGDVPLHPMRYVYEKFRIPKLLIDIPRYSNQIKKYKQIMKREGLEFLKDGVGFNSNELDRHLTFFFITQKRNL